jgi:hypothetical protein
MASPSGKPMDPTLTVRQPFKLIRQQVYDANLVEKDIKDSTTV